MIGEPVLIGEAFVAAAAFKITLNGKYAMPWNNK